MLQNNTKIKVTNRDNGRVGYTIPDLGNLHRVFEAFETKTIPFEELKKLSYRPGGMVILRDYLFIDNAEAVEDLLNLKQEEVAPEYFYTKEDVDNLLLNGSLDELLDCLDFAPVGVIDLVKNEAVNLKINAIDKRQAILEKTGFSVDKAIAINEESERVDAAAAGTAQRRVQPASQNTEPQAEAAPARRTTPKYSVKK